MGEFKGVTTTGRGVLSKRLDTTEGTAIPGPIASFKVTNGSLMVPGRPVTIAGSELLGSINYSTAGGYARALLPYDGNYSMPVDEKYNNPANLDTGYSMLHPLRNSDVSMLGMLHWSARCYRRYRWKSLQLEYVPYSRDAKGAMLWASFADPGMVYQMSPFMGATGSLSGNRVYGPSLANTPGSQLTPLALPSIYTPRFSRDWKYVIGPTFMLPTSTTNYSTQLISQTMLRETMSCCINASFLSFGGTVPTSGTDFGNVTMHYVIELEEFAPPSINGGLHPQDAGTTFPYWHVTTSSISSTERVGAVSSGSEPGSDETKCAVGSGADGKPFATVPKSSTALLTQEGDDDLSDYVRVGSGRQTGDRRPQKQ